MTPLEPFIHVPRIAYFSMEIALRSDIPTYAGGLGVLAGDTLRASADLELPLVAVTLVSRLGYFRQELDAQGRQIEHPDPWSPEQWTRRLDAKISVPVEGRDVWVQAWLWVVKGVMDYPVPVILLDTDVDENDPRDRELTHYLYGGDEKYRFKQEVVLGIGGARMLQALGFDVHTYHMNEGHSAMLTLQLLWRFEHPAENSKSKYDVERVRLLCLFTTHTPVESGHDKFSYDLVREVIDDFVDINVIKSLAGEEHLNMTSLALNLSNYVNGVAKSHALLSNHMFPGYRVHAITNGVHPATWASKSFNKLYGNYLKEWCHEPELLVRADQIPDAELWDAHIAAKQELLEFIKLESGVTLDIERPIIGFSRRMTAYKRPDLLFHDLEKLRSIAKHYPFQLVMSGKAHPRDQMGKQSIEKIHDYMRELGDDVPSVFLKNYNLEIALKMVAGADIWLNTPLPPHEASGTSGMKAALNGVINFSVLDGWWAEGCIEGVTGWGIKSSAEDPAVDVADLYSKLEHTVLPLYYNDRKGWIQVMKGAICKNAYYFNAHRMMRRYATEAYIR
ncbi:MAG: alpha-glucan family phosphorylase [Gammaproteobacteria bacterium]|nr:alpha-glucan family phosphorylase [Gammaproteobacteria bacterium]